MIEKSRRSLLKGAVAAAAVATAAEAQTSGAPQKKVYRAGPKPATPPLFSPAVTFGGLLFIAGMNSRMITDVKAGTEAVLTDIRKQLEASGSSMEKVLKVTVFLVDMNDFAAMNSAYVGKFGDDPPVRTTVAVAALPGGAKVEIDCIASL